MAQFFKDLVAAFRNGTSGFRSRFWRNYIGFQFTFYERRVGSEPPVTSGFQVDLGVATVFYGA